jgi:SAM-dependent methyltransferase
VLGVEPSPEFCRVLSDSNLPHVQGNLTEVRPETHGQFDIIFMAHVLEHFYDPNEALQHCNRLLKPNGLLAVEVPNILKPFRSLDHYFFRYVHLSNFSPQTLRAMLEKHGFQSLHLDEGGQDWRAPQNLAITARKSQVGSSKPVALKGEVEKVCQALLAYRQTWKRVLAPKWYARSLALATRRTIIRAGRPVKRLLLGNRGETPFHVRT